MTLIKDQEVSSERLSIKNLHGEIIPIVTPFLKDGEPLIDGESLDLLIKRLAPYANAFFPAGNAGEGMDLDVVNYKKLLTQTVESRNKHALRDIPIIAGVLKSDLNEISEFCRIAEESSVDGIVIAPMLGDPLNIIEASVNATSLDVLLYANPPMTGGKELPLTIIKHAKENYNGRVVGIKSSTKNRELFKEVLKLKSPTFNVYQGNTEDAAWSLEIGASGIVSGEANLYPKLFQKLWQASHNPGGSDFNENRQLVEAAIRTIRSERKNHNMDFSQIIKFYLKEKGVFQSFRKYHA